MKGVWISFGTVTLILDLGPGGPQILGLARRSVSNSGCRTLLAPMALGGLQGECLEGPSVPAVSVHPEWHSAHGMSGQSLPSPCPGHYRPRCRSERPLGGGYIQRGHLTLDTLISYQESSWRS